MQWRTKFMPWGLVQPAQGTAGEKVTLGATDSAAIEWMKASKNQKTLSLIRKDTYPEMFED